MSGDEAMVLFALAVLALTRDYFDWQRIPPGADALSQKVAMLRRGLDVGKASDATGESGLYDLALANELYERSARARLAGHTNTAAQHDGWDITLEARGSMPLSKHARKAVKPAAQARVAASVLSPAKSPVSE